MDETLRLLRETPPTEQPLARLEKAGPASLSLVELLQIALGSTADPRLPLRLLARWDSLVALEHASPRELRQIPGMTRLRVARVQAMLELARRAQTTEPSRPRINTPADVAALLMPEMSGLDHEQMRVVLLSTKNEVKGIHLVYQGSIHTTVIRVAELFTEAIRANVPSIIVAHNHPSGDPTPSSEDVAVTREIVKAGQLLDIEVLDHLILGGSPARFTSLKERGLGF